MGSMWLDPDEERVFPIDLARDIPPFDASAINPNVSVFPEQRWGADFLSLIVLEQFTKQPQWRSQVLLKVPPLAVGTTEMERQLAMLVDMQKNERAGAMNEIVAQANGFQNYLCAQLGISPKAYPKTYLMMKMAARVGEFVMVYLKNQWPKGVRPSQVYPRLIPPLAVPGHSTYPSGHALVSHMMAYTAYAIIPALSDAPSKLAMRIAVNREIAGLHFPHDTMRGVEGALLAFPFFQATELYGKWLPRAQAEW